MLKLSALPLSQFLEQKERCTTRQFSMHKQTHTHLSMLDEVIKEVVNDVSSKYLDSKAVG